jgi:hypothetical protein
MTTPQACAPLDALHDPDALRQCADAADHDAAMRRHFDHADEWLVPADSKYLAAIRMTITPSDYAVNNAMHHLRCALFHAALLAGEKNS